MNDTHFIARNKSVVNFNLNARTRFLSHFLKDFLTPTRSFDENSGKGENTSVNFFRYFMFGRQSACQKN